MSYFWTSQNLDQLIIQLQQDDYIVFGPKIQDHAIIYDTIESLADLPQGWTEVQAPGSYQLKKRQDSAYFGYVVGPHSWKKFLNPATERLWTARKSANGIEVEEAITQVQKKAFLGVRSCDLKSIKILDKVFARSSHYQTRRQANLIIAVNCVESGTNCFCTSMGTGPKAKEDFDISITELVGEGFIIEYGSDVGHDLIKKVAVTPAKNTQIQNSNSRLEDCGKNMQKQMNTQDIKQFLYDNLNNKIWNDIGERCLSCSNCTMVCPTCFCSTVESHTNLSNTESIQVRRWDSCFNEGHSYAHGGNVHQSTGSRYRQWLTHKLASWHDQFESSGCTGCGRCVTWCPVGIDFTKEISKMRGEA